LRSNVWTAQPWLNIITAGWWLAAFANVSTGPKSNVPSAVDTPMKSLASAGKTPRGPCDIAFVLGTGAAAAASSEWLDNPILGAMTKV
jgi:hypothetical protein